MTGRFSTYYWQLCALVVIALHFGAQQADAQPSVTETIPFGRPPIDYYSDIADDPIAQLNARLKAGTTKLRFEPEHGFLKSVLRELQIPVESQVLVFSKTSLNRKLISPKTPRAIYFNDDVYIGWIPGITSLEVSSVDPQKGGMFYALPLEKEKPPRFVQAKNCLTCHANSNSLQVPGHVVRSFFTDKLGEPTSGRAQITHDSLLSERWGGWYVTGDHGEQSHKGNVVGLEAVREHRQDPLLHGNVTDLGSYFDAAPYPIPDSDIVALMVMEHQAYLQNLVTRLNYETRLKTTPTVEDYLLRYLFFIDEPLLTGEIIGTSGFADVFEYMGPEDSLGRSLRQFDLKTRLFKYRMSYQVYSRAFQGLPAEAKASLYKRIWGVLNGTEKNPDFQKIPAAERQAILEILRETINDLPAYFQE